MTQSPLLEFESSAFAIETGEDENTNPGVYGKALAHWLSEQLLARGRSAKAPIAEDFGWCIPVESSPQTLYAACANAAERANGWRVFVFAEGALLARLFGKCDSRESVASLFGDIKQILQTSPIVQGLHEENT
jgi:hypothetical protein